MFTEARCYDVSSCPRTFPQQLTSDEVAVVKEMATSDEYRHVPTGSRGKQFSHNESGVHVNLEIS